MAVPSYWAMPGFTRPDVSDVAEIICDRAKISMNDIFSIKRHRYTVLVRHTIFAILRHDYKLSYDEIGDMMGRTHSSVVVALQKFPYRVSHEEEVRDLVDHLTIGFRTTRAFVEIVDRC